MRYLLALLCAVLTVSCTGDTSSDPVVSPADQALAEKIDEYMMSGVKKGYAGTLLVAKGGDIIPNKGYGLADQEREIGNTPGTIFDIGSDTKQFTAAAIMKLVDQRKLATTDTLATY
jgi:CubicO group peptidase (beta-lactamase class C family)